MPRTPAAADAPVWTNRIVGHADVAIGKHLRFLKAQGAGRQRAGTED